MYKLILLLIFFDGIALRVYFLQLNEILKVPDSFAYLQMAANFQDLSVSGFGTGWFGFLYSLPIALVNTLVDNLFLSAQIVNIILSLGTGIFLYFIGKRYLDEKYNIVFILLYFLSSTLTHYTLNILSENIYIFLFVFLIYIIHRFLDIIGTKEEVFSLGTSTYKVDNLKEIYLYTILISFILALMYFTRGEAFIYIISIFLIFFILYFRGVITFSRFLKISFVGFTLFLLFISPYVYYLHTLTGEWGLTNKGSSNLRQAEMRSIDNMDDIGFEKAVGELTDDKHHLIHGFAGGLKYDKPQTGISFKDYVFNDFGDFTKRFLSNQIKLYTRTLPGLIIKDGFKEYKSIHSMVHNNTVILFIILLPLFLFGYGVYILLFNKSLFDKSKTNLFLILAPFFITASIFFTLFFVLERYFLIFLPFSFLIIVFGSQELFKRLENMVVFKYILLLLLLSFSFILGTWGYFINNSYNDLPYELKKEAGEWINSNYKESPLKVSERFPIVTYYSGTRERWLVPYVYNLDDLIEYLKFNKVDILVVDSKDFKEYRPMLSFLQNYNKKHKGLELLKVFEKPGERVILYKVNGATLINKKEDKTNLIEKFKNK